MSLRASIKKLAYASGTLARKHERANRQRLTVAMFHRVLAESDERAAGADPEWTVSDVLFRECLSFFAEHYSVIAPAQLDAFARGDSSLPDCPLLLTFDDGWADNAETALPILAEAGMAGHVFVVSSVVGMEREFWQEQLFSAWKRKRLSTAQLSSLWFETGGRGIDDESKWRSPAAIRGLITRLEKLGTQERERLLANFSAQFEDESPAHMVSAEQVRELHKAGMRIGSHGTTHTPLTRVGNVDEELRDSRSALEALTEAPVMSLSFPHGAYDAEVVERCVAAGYKQLFTSDEHLNDVSAGSLPKLIGRINIPAHEIVAGNGELASERLATWLFSRSANV